MDPDFDFATELPRLLALCTKYADREMDLADACLVRMTELTTRCRVWTVDREDFTVYRRHGRQPVPCEFPPVNELSFDKPNGPQVADTPSQTPQFGLNRKEPSAA